MTGFNFPNFPRTRNATGDAGGGGGAPRPPRIPRPGPGMPQTLVTLILALAVVYGGYFWFIRRVVVAPSEVLILLKKDGHRSLPGEEVIVPRMPNAQTDP